MKRLIIAGISLTLFCAFVWHEQDKQRKQEALEFSKVATKDDFIKLLIHIKP